MRPVLAALPMESGSIESTNIPHPSSPRAWPNSFGLCARLQQSQCAFSAAKTTNIVLIIIEKSSQTLQLLIYQRSSSTRRCIFSRVSVSPLAPQTCAQPVIPDLTWCLNAYFSMVDVKYRSWAEACGRGPTIDMSPYATFRSCGSSSMLDFRIQY